MEVLTIQSGTSGGSRGLTGHSSRFEGVADADVFIAVTDDDRTNILCSLLCRQHGTHRTLCLVNLPELLVPLSMALLTEYDDEYLGIGRADDGETTAAADRGGTDG